MGSRFSKGHLEEPNVNKRRTDDRVKHPLLGCDGKSTFVCEVNGTKLYMRIITDPQEMQKRHDCSRLLYDMLDDLKRMDETDKARWIQGYEERIVTNKRCEMEFYSYFVLENEKGVAIAITSGDMYPNPKKPHVSPSFNLRNFFVEQEFRGTGCAQVLFVQSLRLIGCTFDEGYELGFKLSRNAIEASRPDFYELVFEKMGLEFNKTNVEEGKVLFEVQVPRRETLERKCQAFLKDLEEQRPELRMSSPEKANLFYR